MHKIKNNIDRAADALLTALSASLSVIVLTAVFFRYALNQSLSWSDELVRYLFVWFTLLGAAVALREREHIRVDYFVGKLPPQLRRGIECLALCAIGLFQIAMIVLGFMWVYAARGTLTSALQWPLNLLFYAALPCTALLSLWYAARRLVRGEYREMDVDESSTGSESVKGGAKCNS
jgi:TRAP-type C4-dicarboxylate transport system permease small subunit